MIKEYIAYLKDNPQGYWFKARLYGWGWVPVNLDIPRRGLGRFLGRMGQAQNISIVCKIRAIGGVK